MVCDDCFEYQEELKKIKFSKIKKKQTRKNYQKTGYILFFQEKRAEIAVNMSLENRKTTDGVREIGKLWQKLSIEEKDEYNKRAKNY